MEDPGELQEDHFPGDLAVGAAPVCPRTGKITRTDKCVNEAVPLDRGSDYCRECMRNCIGEIGKNGKKLNFRKRKKLCTYSTKGFPQTSCQEHICPSCWAKGYDKHKKRKEI